MRKSTRSPSTPISADSTTTIVDVCSAGLSQKAAKSWRPTSKRAPRAIAATSSGRRTHQTKRLASAVRRREIW
ncbi:hypothetical protein D3C83_85710 [compost metagenome]